MKSLLLGFGALCAFSFLTPSCTNATEKEDQNKSPKAYTAEDLKDMEAIDTHAHLWTKEYLDMLKEAGSEETDVARDLGAYIDEAQVESRLEMMDEAGVKMQVLSATPQSPEYGTEEEAVTLARYINDKYADLMEKYPDRFIAYMALPLPYVEASIAEFRRNLNRPGFKGVALNTIIRKEISPADSMFLPLYEEFNKAKTIVYFHPTGCGAKSPMVQDHGLTWVVGAPIEDLLLPLQLLKADIPGKFPFITFHLAHLGGGLAFQMQRIEDNYKDWGAFKSSPKEALGKFYYDAANFYSGALELSVKTYGASQHMMGSDFPYFRDDKYTRAVTYILNSDLTDEEKAQILHLNAELLYHLK
ncbi:MAG: amidohydrolase family protein [Porphyromonas sp.]|nr:amidohydrolase family protein [Porphyromonas sp.]